MIIGAVVAVVLVAAAGFLVCIQAEVEESSCFKGREEAEGCVGWASIDNPMSLGDVNEQ
jgi:hypothetical protein